MKHFAILTEINDCNYGALLQGFALATVIRQLGAQADQIDFWYRPHNKSLWGTLAKKKTLVGQFWQFLSMALKFHSLAFARARTLRSLRSKSFLESFVPLTPQSYRTTAALATLPTTYDGVIVGSDQVWNPDHMAAPNPFLLANLPEVLPRFAYAASLGVPEVPEARRQEYRSALAKFKAISLREAFNVPEIQSYTTCPVSAVLDPTLLLDGDTWRKLLHLHLPSEAAGETCIYWLGSPEVLLDIARKAAPCHIYTEPSFLSRRLNGKPIKLLLEAIDGVSYHPDAGPLQFLRALDQAKQVISDSYHAMLFCANLGRPCNIVLEATGPRARMRLRMYDFLSAYAQETSVLTSPEDPLQPQHIHLNAAFHEAKNRSRDWLKTVLQLD